jgi:hypothetical protein
MVLGHRNGCCEVSLLLWLEPGAVAAAPNCWHEADLATPTPLEPELNTMPEKLISDASISDSEKKRVTIRILVTRVNNTRH